MSQSYLLLLPAIPLEVWYFRLFYKMITRLTEDEKARFNASGRPIWTFVAIAVSIALLLAPRTELRLIAVPWFILSLTLATRVHHGRLRDLGFSSGFMKHLQRLTTLSFASTTLTVLAFALR